MTCIKTGARVHFENYYGLVVPADIFKVADAVVVRTIKDPNKMTPIPLQHATHTLIAPPGGENEFWRDDLGVFVVPATCLKEL